MRKLHLFTPFLNLVALGWLCASPADLDLTFGTAGKVTTSLGPGANVALRVVQQADGKLVAAGYQAPSSSTNFAVARYLADGGPDPSFNGTGKQLLSFEGGYNYGYGLALQADQKILVAGDSLFSSGPSKLRLCRLRTDGTLDPSFNGVGYVGIPGLAGRAVAVQSDGKIVVAGQSGSDVAVVRFNADGALDATFNGTGQVITPLGGGGAAQVNGLVLQADGKILVAGYANFSGGTDALVFRYLANGSLDATFNGNGKLIRDLGATYEIIDHIVLQADQKIVLGGYSSDPNTKLLLARLNSDGGLDASFNGTGIVITSLTPKIGIGHGLALQTDGKILLGGATGPTSPPFDYDFVLARYNANGSVDTNFTPNGRVVTSFGSENDTCWAVLVQPDQKIVLAGETTDPGGGGASSFALLRYQGSDSTTSVPALLSPASGSSSTNEINVSFNLPEAALAGTVTLTYVGAVTRSFTLAPAQESAGPHAFAFSALTPLASPHILAGNPIPDGTYTVTLSYQDYLGNPAATSLPATGVVLNIDTDGDGIFDRYETGTGVYVSPQDTGTNPTLSDTDGDGLSDGQEVAIFGSNPNLADTDGDGFDDGFEVSTGFSPTSAASTPDAVSSIRTAVEYRFNAANGVSYRIEVSTDLQNWSTVESNIVGTGGVVTRFYSIEGQAEKFYRARRNVPAVPQRAVR